MVAIDFFMPLSPKQAITIIFDDSSYNSQKVDKLNEEIVNYINKEIYENSKSYGGCLVSVEKSDLEPFKNWVRLKARANDLYILC